MKKLLLFSSILIISFTSCKNDVVEEACIAGTGGNITIIAKPQHHGDEILNLINYPDTAYLKFNTQEFPGDNPALYDLVLAGEAPEDHVHIENLKCGKYFVFMTGFDTSIQERVKGGIPIIISENSGEIEIKVPVTED